MAGVQNLRLKNMGTDVTDTVEIVHTRPKLKKITTRQKAIAYKAFA
jgi:hypothetical protein